MFSARSRSDRIVDWLTVRHKTPAATGSYTIGIKKRA